MQLPLFENVRPIASRLKLSGLTSDEDVALKIGDAVFLLVEAEITEVAHVSDPKKGFLRIHKAQIIRASQQDGDLARKILDEMGGTPQLEEESPDEPPF